jgi:hypothetical protein
MLTTLLFSCSCLIRPSFGDNVHFLRVIPSGKRTKHDQGMTEISAPPDILFKFGHQPCRRAGKQNICNLKQLDNFRIVNLYGA